jgi:hypothetical protein
MPVTDGSSEEGSQSTRHRTDSALGGNTKMGA